MLKVEPAGIRLYPVAMIRRPLAAAAALAALAATGLGLWHRDRADAAAPVPAPPAAIAALHARGMAMVELATPVFRYDDAKFRGYDTLAFTALHGCDPAKAQGMAASLDPAFLKKSVDGAALAFSLPPLVRYMRLYPQCLTPDQTRLIRSFLGDRQPLFTHGTLNHALMTATSFYLLAEMFPDQKWHEGQGAPFTSAQVIARYRGLLLGRFAATMAHGHNEQLSTTYAIADLYPLLNLIDFARDPVIRRAAEVVAIAQIAMLRADSADGFVLPPYSREGAAQQGRWPRTNTSDLLWFYYGNGERPPHLPSPPTYVAMFATSAWRPPAALLALQSPADLPYAVRTVTPAFSEWAKSGAPELFGSAWIARNFAIGSGEVASGGKSSDTAAVAFAIQPRGVDGGPVECTPDGAGRASPVQQTWQRGSEGALLYRGVSAVRCRVGPGADEMVRDEDAVAYRFGRIAVALRFPGQRVRIGPLGSRGEREAMVPGPRAVVTYAVAPLGDGETLASFKTKLAGRGARWDAAADRLTLRTVDGKSAAIAFADPRAVAGRMASRARVTIDGAIPPAPSGDYFDSPILKVGNGRFTLRSTADTLTGSVIGETATLAR